MFEPDEIETAACPVCNSNDFQVAYDRFKPYFVVQCQSCSVYYLSPRPSEEAARKHYMSGDYFTDNKFGYSDYQSQEKNLRATFRRFLQNLKKASLDGGSLLDVGCGNGYLLAEAKPLFDRRVGLELDPQAAATAAKHCDHIFKEPVDLLPATEKFNCITAINVIEHIYRPIDFLSHLRNHLQPNGSLVIATPDMGSFWRRLMGGGWPSFKIPEHILFFNRQNLESLFNKAGFTTATPISFPHAFPLSLVASKLHLSLPSFCSNIQVWIPQTMTAVYGVNNGR
jgi:SAM-dependent methyltransferase